MYVCVCVFITTFTFLTDDSTGFSHDSTTSDGTGFSHDSTTSDGTGFSHAAWVGVGVGVGTPLVFIILIALVITLTAAFKLKRSKTTLQRKLTERGYVKCNKSIVIFNKSWYRVFNADWLNMS